MSIAAKTDASLVRMDSNLLSELMLSSQPIRKWANAVMRSALNEKAGREWCLTALGGADRLIWFRTPSQGLRTNSLIH